MTHLTNQSAVIRLFKEQDLPNLLKQHFRTFPADRSISSEQMEHYFRKKFFENPAGAAVGAVAYANNEIVGSYLMIPVNIKIHDAVYTLFQITEFVVHPDFRKSKIALKLFSFLLKEFETSGKIFFIFGTPTTASEKAHIHFAWRWGKCRSFPLTQMMIPLNFLALAEKKIRKPLTKAVCYGLNPLLTPLLIKKKRCHIFPVSGLSINEITSPPADYSRFWASMRNLYSNIIVRDLAFIRWRFFDTPFPYRFYEVRQNGVLRGYYVLKNQKKKLWLVDFFLADAPELKKAICERILEQARQQKAWSLSYCTTHERRDENFTGLKKIPSKGRAFICGFFVGKNEAQNKENTLLMDRMASSPDWYLTYNIEDMG